MVRQIVGAVVIVIVIVQIVDGFAAWSCVARSGVKRDSRGRKAAGVANTKTNLFGTR